jgi:hypothetical protein
VPNLTTLSWLVENTIGSSLFFQRFRIFEWREFWHTPPPMPELPPTAASTVAGDGAGSPPPEGVTERAQPMGANAAREIGGPPGPEPTRYGDWEKNGRCIDF